MVRRFRDRVCIVTGAASGIGRATTLLLAREGGTVVLVDLDDAGAAVANEAGADAHFVQADVSAETEVEAAVAAALEHTGQVDVLVNNAGAMSFSAVADTDTDTWNRVLATNATAAFLLSRMCIPAMPSGGAIVNVSSIHAQRSTRLVAPYAASKAALEALTRVLSIELASAGIRVNAVAPGAIDTPMLWSNPNIKSGAERLDGPVGRPEDVAAAIAYLASGDAAFVNGITLPVDCGRLAAL